MLLLRPAIFAFAATLKYLVPTLTSHDLPTYLGITVVDAGIRTAHFVTYASLSRSRLQLPVGAFLPAPEALQTSDIVLYAAPAAVATWRLRFGLEELTTFGRHVVSRVADGLSRQREYLSKRFVAPTPLLLAEESAPPGLWSYPEGFNKSIIWTGDGYPARHIPSAFVFQTEPIISSSPIVRSDLHILLAVSTWVAGSFPRVDMCIPPTLGTCPAGRSSDAPIITPSAPPAYRPNLALLDELEGPTELIVYEPPPHYDEFALSLNVLNDEPYVIYVRACLVGLLAIRCIAFIIITCITFILLHVLRLARSIFNLAHILLMSSCSMAKHLLTNVLETLANTYSKSWRPVLEAYIPYATRTQIPPVALPVEAEMPVAVASSRKKNKKRKSKARKKSRRASGPSPGGGSKPGSTGGPGRE
ncbi:hypothetical protein FRC08_008519 [Ceratobasidium sp. 394]|nr:hypothetical protein FRC08_008519 [Ceratobasidium sp. 394]